MILSWIWLGLVSFSILFAIVTGQISAVSAASVQGAQSGITLAISMAGPLCLWAGVGVLMEKAGITPMLSRLLRPILGKLFPTSKTDAQLASDLSGNICANFLGLGNAATPMGIRAAKRMVNPRNPQTATNQLCRLIVLNTASIQLIPATVAALRASLGCDSPFDILPAVWLTSICSVTAGLLAAGLLGRLCRHG